MHRARGSLVAFVIATAACSDPSSTPAIDAATDGPSVDGDPDPDRTAALALMGMPCSDDLDAPYQARTPPVSWTADDRGTVVACAYERKLGADELRAHFATAGLPAVAITTGAYRYRVAYWTERDEGQPVLTSATLFIPEVRRGAPSPLVVAGHGSVGSADLCAPSRDDGAGFQRDVRTQIFPLIGDGWIVIAPDYPGLGTPGVATWQLATDEGHAMLDATRAARRLTRAGLLSSKNALVGHSNGGHAALAAQSYARAYGSEGTVDAVVVWAPLWISNAAWGALASDTGAVLLTPPFIAMMLMYLDAHLEVYGGADDAYLTGQGQAVRRFLESACWQITTRAETGFPSIGITTGRDVFTPDFVTEVGDCGLVGTCTTPLAAAWRTRFAADRPPADPTIPIVLWQGVQDDFLSPGYQQCGIDRLAAQGAQLTTCADFDADHSSISSRSSTWVTAYLAHRLLGAAAPAACTPFSSITPAPSCSVPIANGTAPTDP